MHEPTNLTTSQDLLFSFDCVSHGWRGELREELESARTALVRATCIGLLPRFRDGNGDWEVGTYLPAPR
jgi:hypothetical protein